MSTWANTWFAGIDGVQHPGVTVHVDPRLTTRGTLRVKIKEAKDLQKGMILPQFCSIRVGENESKVDAIVNNSEVRWNADLDFVLEGGEEYIHVTFKNEERTGRSPIVATCLIPLSELLCSIHPTLPPPPPPPDQSSFQEEEATKAKAEARKALVTDCKHITDAIDKANAVPDHVKDALRKLLAGAQVDPPRHGAWFTLYDEKLTACGKISMQFHFFPDYYQLIPIKKSHDKIYSAPSTPTSASTISANKLKSVTTAASGMAGAVRAVAGTAAGAVLGMAKSVHAHANSLTDQPADLPKEMAQLPPGKFFGVPLSVAIEQSNAPIPLPVSLICEFLEKNSLNTEGLFRVGGNKNNVDALIDAFKRGDKVVLEDTHDASGTLKAFFRQMPEPLIPFSHYTGIVAIADDKKKALDDKKFMYASLLCSLPEHNINVLRYLMTFLAKVAERSSVNLMAAENLAIVFGPNLLRPEEEDVGTLLGDTGAVNQAISTIIAHSSSILPPPKAASPIPAPAIKQPPARPASSRALNPAPIAPAPTAPTTTAPTTTSGPSRPPPSAAQALEYTQNKLLAGVVTPNSSSTSAPSPSPAPPGRDFSKQNTRMTENLSHSHPNGNGRAVTLPLPASKAAPAPKLPDGIRRCEECLKPLKPVHKFCVECGKPCLEGKDLLPARPRSETMTPRILAAAKAFEG